MKQHYCNIQALLYITKYLILKRGNISEEELTCSLHLTLELLWSSGESCHLTVAPVTQDICSESRLAGSSDEPGQMMMTPSGLFLWHSATTIVTSVLKAE